MEKIKVLLIALCIILSGCAAKGEKTYRVGILCSFEPFMIIADSFKEKMTELGYIEGQNIVYDVQISPMDPNKGKASAKKFVEEKVDLIFAFSTEAAVEARDATEGTDIPVVFAMSELEGNNLVQSISKPGGHITGVRYTGSENTLKRFEILHEIVPDIQRLYVIYNKNYPANPPSLEALRPVVSSLGMTLVEEPIASIEGLQAAIQAMSELNDIDAILIMPDDLSQSPPGFESIIQFANEYNVPIGGGAGNTADMGAMFSYVPDFFEVGTLSADIANKILKGTSPAEIMVITAVDRFRLNYKSIETLGLNISDEILARADEVIR